MTIEEHLNKTAEKNAIAALAAAARGDAPLQGSAAWLYERVGFCTASRFKDVLDKLKNGQPGAKRKSYLWEVAIERLTGQPSDHFASAAMQWGSEQEGASRMAYEAATGRMVEEVGFIKHATLPFVGGSPDGLIGEDGGWESKSPFNSAVHLGTILDGIPGEHMAQIQGLMWLTGRQWWDFQSYDPRMSATLQRYCQRVLRDEGYIATLSAEVIAFNAEVDALVTRLTGNGVA